MFVGVTTVVMCHNGGNEQNKRGKKSGHFAQFIINSVGLYSRATQIPGALLPRRLNCVLLAPYIMVTQYGTYCVSPFRGLEFLRGS